MNTSTIRKKLSEYIKVADDKKVKAIYTIVEREIDEMEVQSQKILKKNIPTENKLSDKYAGKLPMNVANDLQKHIEKSRNEWDSNI